MLRKALPTLLLAAALLMAALLASRSSRARFSSLQVPDGGIEQVYLQMKAGVSDKCLVGGRGRTTSKRSEQDFGKASWRCRLEGQAPFTFVAQSKLEPSFLFVPVTRVDDTAFPWVYETLRSELGWPAPPMRWVHLFHNRQFRGLYLEVQLPARAFAAEHTWGRVELLAMQNQQLICFDRKMRPLCPIYNLAVADGVFPLPQSSPAADLLFDLADQTATDGNSPQRVFALSDTDYRVLHPLPLPFSVHLALPSAERPYRDARYERWIEDSPAADRTELPLITHSLQKLDMKTRLAPLPASFAASCQVMDCDSDLLLERLRASPSLAWLLAATQGSSPSAQESTLDVGSN